MPWRKFNCVNGAIDGRNLSLYSYRLLSWSKTCHLDVNLTATGHSEKVDFLGGSWSVWVDKYIEALSKQRGMYLQFGEYRLKLMI